jgi:hypothetical protein
MLEDIIKKYGGVEVDAMDVYRDVFHLGEGYIQKDGEERGKFKANPVAYWKNDNCKKGHYRILFEDTFEETLKELQEADFAIMNGLTYFGRKNIQEHASKCYALMFDYDGVTDEKLNNYLYAAFSKDFDIYPLPNYIIMSGHGLHLYYVFEEPIPLYPNIKLQLKAFKYAMTEKMWNPYTSTEEHKQFQGINQGFRVIGGKTKIEGVRSRAFRINTHPHTLAEMGRYIPEESQVDEGKLFKESKMTLAEAKLKYPEWYEQRVLNKEPKGHWTTKRDLYDWWKRMVGKGATYHHRYFDIMCLAIYAVKAGITMEELERDAMGLIPFMNSIEDSKPFTVEDVQSALECYDLKYITFPIEDIVKLSGIDIKRNKRNGRKQDKHLQGARAIRDINNENWREGNGRKNKQRIVGEWQNKHPDGTKYQCIKDTGLDKKTVYKWWSTETTADKIKALITELSEYKPRYRIYDLNVYDRRKFDNRILTLLNTLESDELYLMGFENNPIDTNNRRNCERNGKGLIDWEIIRPNNDKWLAYWKGQGLELPDNKIIYWHDDTRREYGE